MKTRKSVKTVTLLVIGIYAFLLSSCGTTTGNSLVQSEAFSPTESLLAFPIFPTSGESGWHSGPGGPVNDFRMCVKKVRMIDSSGSTKKKDGTEDIEFNAGLIDLSSGEAVQWGSVEVPVGFELSRLYIQLQRDAELCPSFDYALKFNEHGVDSTIVLKFRFIPAIELAVGDTLTLSVQELARGLLNLANSGDLHSGNLKDSAEQIEESAKKTNR